MDTDLKNRWKKIKAFAMDVDGILTDGCIYTFSDGKEAKRFSIIDGMGLALLKKAGIKLAWISGRHSDSTTVRAKELGISYLIQGFNDKKSALQDFLEKTNLSPEEVVYMGDDIIDTPAIELAGIGVTVPEAQKSAIDAADYVTVKSGGNGAVREICNQILDAQSI